MSFSVTPVSGMPLIRPGDDLPSLLCDALERLALRPANGDVIVVCQKVVSKSEGRVVDLRTVDPSPAAHQVARSLPGKDPRIIEIILRETTQIVRLDGGRLIVETGPGWVCANAGVDESNSGDPDTVVLLPRDPDASAARIVSAVETRFQARVAAIVTDTFGRPWREGLVDFALGVAGIDPLLDLRGRRDLDGRELHHTVIAHADALAAAAGLVMPKGGGVPAAVIRGYAFTPAPGGGAALIRPRANDLFR